MEAGGAGAVARLLGLLSPEPRDPLIAAGVEVLWNCLERSKERLELDGPAASRTQLLNRRRTTNAMYEAQRGGRHGGSVHQHSFPLISLESLFYREAVGGGE